MVYLLLLFGSSCCFSAHFSISQICLPKKNVLRQLGYFKSLFLFNSSMVLYAVGSTFKLPLKG